MAKDDPAGVKGRVAQIARRGLARLRRAATRDRAPQGVSPTSGPPSVRFNEAEPMAVTEGITILEAATHAGLDIDHYCGGQCSCGTCRVEIQGGGAALTPMEGRERMVLGFERAQAGDRLACQARVRGPVSVRVPRWF